jgi:hypothetical protein
LCEVAAVQGQLPHRALLDDFSEFGRLSLDERSRFRNFDGFGHLSDLQQEIHTGLLVNLQFDAGPDFLLESPRLDGKRVGAGNEERGVVVSELVGRIDLRRALTDFGDSHLDVRHDCPGVVLHRSENSSTGDLR